MSMIVFYCYECKSELDILIKNGDIYINPCKQCTDFIKSDKYNEGNQNGYNNGYDVGYDDGKSCIDDEYLNKIKELENQIQLLDSNVELI